MVNVPIQIHDCDSHSPSLLHLLISSDPSICSTVAFLPLGNSDQIVVSIPIHFSLSVEGNAPFHHTASCADGDCFHDQLRDAPSKDIFKLGASGAAAKFCEWIQFETDVCIPPKYQASFISVVFSCFCCYHSS